ncbi:hypothetical protein MLD38_025468 [Melastoma candidum]|uniref:Uncharacterized protein n=1 Tax=Melastoma candidum TaxID=119954 RepID=A0ACB9NX28_9MYRT|nr:hypothetical protein MLD38_025468 [Melastoma candidum]
MKPSHYTFCGAYFFAVDLLDGQRASGSHPHFSFCVILGSPSSVRSLHCPEGTSARPFPGSPSLIKLGSLCGAKALQEALVRLFTTLEVRLFSSFGDCSKVEVERFKHFAEAYELNVVVLEVMRLRDRIRGTLDETRQVGEIVGLG